MGLLVSIDDLTFTYRGSKRPALRNIRGEMGAGCTIVLMGHGGAGKTSLCCSLNGLIPHFMKGEYHGHVRVKGRETAEHKVAEMSSDVGLIFQDFESQLFSTNVELEMAFGPENQCLDRREIEHRIRRYLDFVGLEHLRRRDPATLSGGQKQRLAIGSVLTMEPKILVMDEPMTDLDPEGREEILSLAGTLRMEGRVLFIVDHDPETAVAADEVWLMKEGRIVAQGLPSELLTDAALLRSCGIRPLPVLDLFEKMGCSEKPLTAEAAISLIEKKGISQCKSLPPVASSGKNAGAVLEVRNLSYVYPAHHVEALRGIDLSIREGEFLAILGKNGSGKTTLAKHFNGLLKPTAGGVWVRGKPVTAYRRAELAKEVGYVFQNPDHQIFAKTVEEEVGFGLKNLGENPSTIGKRVDEALDIVELRDDKGRVPFTLTKGERQRLAVASVLAAQPRVIVLDEPTTGLDDSHQRSTMEMLKRLNKAGHTVIIITHSLWVAAEYTDRTVIMKDGVLLADGPTRLIFADEARMAAASLRIPPLLRLSNRLGTRAMTVDGMVDELRKRPQTPLKR